MFPHNNNNNNSDNDSEIYIYISLVAFYPNMYIYIPQFISKLNPMISYYIILSNLKKSLLNPIHSSQEKKKSPPGSPFFHPEKLALFTMGDLPCLPWGDKKWNYHGDMSTI